MNKIKQILALVYRFFYPLDPVDMYRKMGVKIGEGTKIQFEVVIDYSHFWLIELGADVTLAPRVHILAHDASTKNDIGYTRLKKVLIQDNVFIGAGSIILPGVTIGKNSIIGAGSVVTNDVPDNQIYAGNPARKIGDKKAFLAAVKKELDDNVIFDESYLLHHITKEKQKKMCAKIGDASGFIA